MALREGHRLLSRGHYEEALNEYYKVLTIAEKKPPHDEALFHMGLIYANTRYPKRDTKKSMEFFTAILNHWPESPLVEQAKICLGLLHENERVSLLLRQMRHHETKPQEAKPAEPKEKNAEEEEPKLLSQRLMAAKDFESFIRENQKVLTAAHPQVRKDEALFNLGLAYAHEGNPKKDFSKSLEFFKRLIHEHPKSPWADQAKIWVGLLQEYQSLRQVIEKLKQVDIEVEEKKREKSK